MAVVSCSCETGPDLAVSAAVNHFRSAAFHSAREIAPSLSVSAALDMPAATNAPPRAPPPGAWPWIGWADKTANAIAPVPRSATDDEQSPVVT